MFIDLREKEEREGRERERETERDREREIDELPPVRASPDQEWNLQPWGALN